MSMLPALTDLPSVEKARLPAIYEGARTALSECSRIDECQDWADKAEALASYAKQAQDEELRRMADRIQARAIRRCGELLNQIRSASGGDRGNAATGGRPPVGETRTGAARDAGLSDHQRKTATRVARVPGAEFDEAVEREEPPTVTALAELGKLPPRHDHLAGREPEDFRNATALLGLLHHIVRTSKGIDVNSAVCGLATREVDDALTSLADAEQWIERVADALRN